MIQIIVLMKKLLVLLLLFFLYIANYFNISITRKHRFLLLDSLTYLFKGTCIYCIAVICDYEAFYIGWWWLTFPPLVSLKLFTWRTSFNCDLLILSSDLKISVEISGILETFLCTHPVLAVSDLTHFQPFMSFWYILIKSIV